MTITHSPPEPSLPPVSVGNDPVSACAVSVEGRIAEEVVAMLQDWLHQLSACSVAPRRSSDSK